MSKLQPVRGTHDLLPEEFAKFFAIQSVARNITTRYGFAEMATPIFEFTEVFARTMGETSDVVTKEMYTFKDRGDESITLRPEFTAGIVRSFISNGLQQNLPLKLFTTGPVFRYERPQKGRQRQFHQLNVEWLGASGWASDTEVILMAADLLSALGIKAELQINSLGDSTSRNRHRTAFVEYLSKYKNDLSEESKARLEKNPLRIMDSKNEGDRKILNGAPVIKDFWTDEAADNFNNISISLGKNNVQVNYNYHLVRGLDYYNDVVFEFVSGDLGAQNTVLAGGRYDGLVSTMGGPETPAVGWGAGLERLMLLSNISANKPKPVVVIAGSDELKSKALQLAQKLRSENKTTEIAHQTNIGKALKYANKLEATHAYIIGEDEAKKGIVLVKDLNSGEQSEQKL